MWSARNKPVMNEPSLYQSNNRHQRRDAAEALAEYASRMRWREGSRVLDVGCGDGGVTVQVLRPHLLPSAQLDACDISPEMVRHAREHHADANVSFRMMDIAADPPDDMLGRYDHVFSFYALHWVQQQRKALSNIASMLSPSGECLLVLMCHIPIYDAYRLMAAQPAWAEVMVDVEQFVSPYHDCKLEAQCRFSDLLLSSGFHHVKVTIKHKDHVYEGVECFRKAMQAISPFNHRLDSKKQERFLDDFVDVFRDMGLLQPMKNNEDDDITPDGLVAIPTLIGHLIMGAVRNVPALPEEECAFRVGLSLSQAVQRFWEVEEPPTVARINPEHQECELFYKNNTEIWSARNKPVMNDPSLYQSNNRHSRRDAAEALAEYAGLMRWRAGSRVLDVGCGDGSVTVQVLRPHLPPGARLDACDISPEMVRHAREHHSDANVNFQMVDVAADLPDDMLGRYDYVFSFYALQWVQQQRKALSNIASMLSPGGECLLVLMGHLPIYDAYRLMAAKPAWAEFMADVEQFVSPYHDYKLEANCRFRDLLLSSGFHHVKVATKLKVYSFGRVECFRKAMQALSPFICRLDPKQQERYLDDFVDVFREMGMVQPMKNNEEDVITRFGLQENKSEMNDPRLYQSTNKHPRRDTAEALAEFAGRMRWRAGSRVHDLGCGDGSVTVQVLRPHLPPGTQLDASDISPEMVRHAREHHSDANVSFRIMDIAADLPDDMVGRYDHVFSFYALHWVQQQRKALSNIASMLTPGGECLLELMGHLPIFDAYRLMAAKPAWAEVMADVEQFVSPYHDGKLEAQCHFRDLLLSSGFHHVNVTTKLKVYAFEGVESFRDAMQAVSPFYRRLDPKKQERFLDDFVDVFRNMGMVQPMKNNEENDITVRFHYMQIVAHAVK